MPHPHPCHPCLPFSSSSPSTSQLVVTSYKQLGTIGFVNGMKVKALYASTLLENRRWLLDLGTSHYMTSSMDMFSLFEPCYLPNILMHK